MTTEEIQKYADELAQQYFPDEYNPWARENVEANFVAEACIRMAYIVAKHIEQELIKKACEWLEDTDFDMKYWNSEEGFCKGEFIEDFRRAMEE